MARAFTGDPDPLVYLIPLVGSMAISNVWPAFEHVMNVLFSWLAGIVALGTVIYISWLFWGPLPSARRAEKRRWAQKESSRA